jgi:hypothetical protein
VRKSIQMERASEERERGLRSSAVVTASDFAVCKAKPASLEALCERRFGAKAVTLFTEELHNASRYRVSEPQLAADGARVVCVTEVQSCKTRQLSLAAAQQLWQCSCSTPLSFGVPCRHLVRHLQGVKDVTFDTYAAYFHKRWEINTQLPDKEMLKIAVRPAELKRMLAKDGEAAVSSSEGAGAGAGAGTDAGAGADDDDWDTGAQVAAAQPMEAVMSFVTANMEKEATVLEVSGARGLGRPASKR